MSLFNSIRKMLTGEPTPPAAPAPLPAPAVAAFDYGDDRVPESAQERIRRILSCLNEAQDLMEREHFEQGNRAELDLIRSDHLPKLVRSYVDIPPAHRAEIFRKTGKSASFILDESLDVMQARIDEILKRLAQHDLDAFTNNTAFIGRRYASQNPFD